MLTPSLPISPAVKVGSNTVCRVYGYDSLSRLRTATNPAGTVTIAYDNRSRVSSVTDAFGQVVSYQYDANSNRTQLSLNGATNATYQYDVINRLTQLTDNAALNVTFVYDATNKLTSRTLPNGVVSTYQYDGLNRLTRLTHAKTPNTLLDLPYQFNAVNNITQMIDNAGTHNYSYDSLDRLTAATHPNQPNESYTYDDVGNRTASHQGASYSYQPFNRLVTANGTSFGYDGNGNQSSKTDGTGSWTYTWDYENRLKQASVAGGVSVNYFDDALGRRVQRTSTMSGTEKFVYDGADVVRDLDGSNATLADYLNGPGIDNKLRQTNSGTASYFITDHLGTTRGLADSTGTITSNLQYDSFGRSVSGFAPTRYTYTGREIDSDMDLTYYRARWYEPTQGRFASEDPIGFSGGDVNLYRYVGSSPVRFGDPLGLQKRSDSQTQPGEIEAMRRLAKAVQAMGNCPGGTSIYICCRDININFLTEILSKVTGVRHCFIRTPNTEAGMNPAGNGAQPLWPIGIPTEITDHTGQSKTASCVPACNVDQKCVERELEIGRSTGKWSLSNNCNTVANEIVRKCQKSCRK